MQNDTDLTIHGLDEEDKANHSNNLLDTLAAKDGAEYTRDHKGTLVKVKESNRRYNSTKANSKAKKEITD